MKNLSKTLAIVAITVSSIAMTGCVTTQAYSQGSLRGDVYSYKEARKLQNVTIAQIISLRPVIIEKDTTKVGMGIGGLLGAVAGSQIGGGDGRKVATAIGGLLGATAGDKVESKIRKVQGVEVIVRTSNGRTHSVVQEYHGEQFSIGQTVSLIGQSRNMRVAIL